MNFYKEDLLIYVKLLLLTQCFNKHDMLSLISEKKGN